MAHIARPTRRRAATVVEAALVFPLLLLLLLGLLEYGWIFLRAQEITHAARSGARVGARADATNQDACDAVDAWMDEAGFSETGSYTCTPSVEVAPGELVTVTVTGYGLDVMGSFVPSPDSYVETVTMAKEGPGAPP